MVCGASFKTLSALDIISLRKRSIISFLYPELAFKFEEGRMRTEKLIVLQSKCSFSFNVVSGF